MIIICTTTKLSWNDVYHYSLMLHKENPGSSLLEHDVRLTSAQLLEWTDNVINLHKDNPSDLFIVPTLSEEPVLRILRRIREEDDVACADSSFVKRICGKDFLVHHLNESEDRKVAHLRADDSGEFIDCWPDGFHDWRMGELF